MMAGELSCPDGNFTRQSYPEFVREYAGGLAPAQDKQALVKQLQDTLAEGIAKIESAGEPLMLQPIVQFSGEPATRLSWMGHGVAHEEYHRGQLTLCARLLGLVPALTKLIEGT